MTELHIPDEALDEWVRITRDPLRRVPTVEAMTACVAAVSRLVVVAELRRLCPGALVTKAQIEARIAELEGER